MGGYSACTPPIRLNIAERNGTLRTTPCFILAVLITGAMGGCALIKGGSSATLPSSAFFRSDGSQLNKLRAIAMTQDSQIKACHKGLACEDAYYTRGLVALFENRADAVTVFQQLHTVMPTSRYDVATLGWLNLLQDSTLSSVSSHALREQLREEVLHTLLSHFDLATVQNGIARDVHIAELNR